MAKSCERSTPDEVVIHDEPREPVTDPTLGIPVEAPRSADPAHRLVTIGDSLTHGFMSGAVFRTDLSWPALVAYELGLPAEGFRFPTYEWPTGPGGLPVDLERLARAFERRYGPKLDFTEIVGAALWARSYLDSIEDYWERGPGAATPPSAQPISTWSPTITPSVAARPPRMPCCVAPVAITRLPGPGIIKNSQNAATKAA